jgi:2-deoxystreptamine N-acetyl-D-glucosaminyltransferase/2-deoxystreptamine glucosyltransferase
MGDSVTNAPDSDDERLQAIAGMRVLRLCSVFEPVALSERSARYDAIGGMQNHTAELSRQLDLMGARQLILTSRLDGPAGSARFGQHGRVVRTGVDMRLGRQAWAPLAAPLALSRSQVDVVHAHCGEDIAILPLARLAARRHRCPLVITVHSGVRHNVRITSARTAWLRLAGGLAEHRALGAADMVIALTETAAERLVREGIPDGRIRVIPPGYDPGLFALDAPDPVPDLGRPRVGYVGRIAPQKDVGTLISAFGRINEPASLLIVGDGPGRAAAEQQAQAVAGPVRFTGFVPHVQIAAVLRTIDVLVLATRYEELPSVLIEGMAAGLPVIASQVGGIPNLIDQGVNGILVPPGDAAALAAAITRVLAEPGTAARLAESARLTAQRYAWPALARQVAAVYLQVTGKAHPPGLLAEEVR